MSATIPGNAQASHHGNLMGVLLCQLARRGRKQLTEYKKRFWVVNVSAGCLMMYANDQSHIPRRRIKVKDIMGVTCSANKQNRFYTMTLRTHDGYKIRFRMNSFFQRDQWMGAIQKMIDTDTTSSPQWWYILGQIDSRLREVTRMRGVHIILNTELLITSIPDDLLQYVNEAIEGALRTILTLAQTSVRPFEGPLYYYLTVHARRESKFLYGPRYDPLGRCASLQSCLYRDEKGYVNFDITSPEELNAIFYSDVFRDPFFELALEERGCAAARRELCKVLHVRDLPVRFQWAPHITDKAQVRTYVTRFIQRAFFVSILEALRAAVKDVVTLLTDLKATSFPANSGAGVEDTTGSPGQDATRMPTHTTTSSAAVRAVSCTNGATNAAATETAPSSEMNPSSTRGAQKSMTSDRDNGDDTRNNVGVLSEVSNGKAKSHLTALRKPAVRLSALLTRTAASKRPQQSSTNTLNPRINWRPRAPTSTSPQNQAKSAQRANKVSKSRENTRNGRSTTPSVARALAMRTSTPRAATTPTPSNSPPMSVTVPGVHCIAPAPEKRMTTSDQEGEEQQQQRRRTTKDAPSHTTAQLGACTDSPAVECSTTTVLSRSAQTLPSYSSSCYTNSHAARYTSSSFSLHSATTTSAELEDMVVHLIASHTTALMAVLTKDTVHAMETTPEVVVMRSESYEQRCRPAFLLMAQYYALVKRDAMPRGSLREQFHSTAFYALLQSYITFLHTQLHACLFGRHIPVTVLWDRALKAVAACVPLLERSHVLALVVAVVEVCTRHARSIVHALSNDVSSRERNSSPSSIGNDSSGFSRSNPFPVFPTSASASVAQPPPAPPREEMHSAAGAGLCEKSSSYSGHGNRNRASRVTVANTAPPMATDPAESEPGGQPPSASMAFGKTDTYHEVGHVCNVAAATVDGDAHKAGGMYGATDAVATGISSNSKDSTNMNNGAAGVHVDAPLSLENLTFAVRGVIFDFAVHADFVPSSSAPHFGVNNDGVVTCTILCLPESAMHTSFGPEWRLRVQQQQQRANRVVMVPMYATPAPIVFYTTTVGFAEWCERHIPRFDFSNINNNITVNAINSRSSNANSIHINSNINFNNPVSVVSSSSAAAAALTISPPCFTIQPIGGNNSNAVCSTSYCGATYGVDWVDSDSENNFNSGACGGGGEGGAESGMSINMNNAVATTRSNEIKILDMQRVVNAIYDSQFGSAYMQINTDDIRSAIAALTRVFCGRSVDKHDLIRIFVFNLERLRRLFGSYAQTKSPVPALSPDTAVRLLCDYCEYAESEVGIQDLLQHPPHHHTVLTDGSAALTAVTATPAPAVTDPNQQVGSRFFDSAAPPDHSVHSSATQAPSPTGSRAAAAAAVRMAAPESTPVSVRVESTSRMAAEDHVSPQSARLHNKRVASATTPAAAATTQLGSSIEAVSVPSIETTPMEAAAANTATTAMPVARHVDASHDVSRRSDEPLDVTRTRSVHANSAIAGPDNDSTVVQNTPLSTRATAAVEQSVCSGPSSLIFASTATAEQMDSAHVNSRCTSHVPQTSDDAATQQQSVLHLTSRLFISPEDSEATTPSQRYGYSDIACIALQHLLPRETALAYRSWRVGLLLGLSNTGKTLIANCMRGAGGHTVPTVGMSLQVFPFQQWVYGLHEIGGRESFRRNWCYYTRRIPCLHFIIFVVDSCRSRCFDEAGQYLLKVVQLLSDIPLLIILNNYRNLPQQLPQADLVKAIGIDKIRKTTSAPCVICTCDVSTEHSASRALPESLRRGLQDLTDILMRSCAPGGLPSFPKQAVPRNDGPDQLI